MLLTTAKQDALNISNCRRISQDTTSYYGHFRKNILEYVPQNTKCALSVGCGAGITEAELVKQGVTVFGIEINHEAAKAARQRGLIIFEGDASAIDIDAVDELFDCLIYADVLEHLSDPVEVLKRHVSKLKRGGTVIVSVPNFRHYSVFWQLFVRGYLKYEDAGILDRTHLKITTRKTLIQWFGQVNLELVSCRLGIDRRRDKLISAVLFGLPREFVGTQIVAVGRKP